MLRQLTYHSVVLPLGQRRCLKEVMQKSAVQLQNVGSLQQSVRNSGSWRSQMATGQHSSPTVFPEKRNKVKTHKQMKVSVTNDPEKFPPREHKIDIVDERSDLLGYEVFSGKLALDKKPKTVKTEDKSGSGSGMPDAVDAKLTSKALIWGSRMLSLEEVVSVSYNFGLRHFTVHAYPDTKRSCGFSCFLKPRRCQKDFRFLAATSEEAIQWVSGFADQQCFINCLPHPMVSNKKPTSDIDVTDFLFDQPRIKSKSPPKVLVVLNPHSGHGRSSKVFHGKVEPIFKLAGFKMVVVKTTHAGHAKNLASDVDFSTCPDGIICVGGDGIVNEVLNGLLSRENQKEAISIPIGIIPAGSDNSLVWTVLGVKDPISAAMAIVKGAALQPPNYLGKATGNPLPKRGQIKAKILADAGAAFISAVGSCGCLADVGAALISAASNCGCLSEVECREDFPPTSSPESWPLLKDKNI